jgi:hypothetical protein
MHHVILFSLLVPSLQALLINNQPSEQPKQLVILRAYSPHEHGLLRMKSYFDDVKENVPGSRFLISVDTTSHNAVDLVKQHVPEADIHVYDKSAVERAYQNAKLDGWTGWTWHMEPINLAVKYAIDRFGSAFDHVWMMEDDVLICGGIAKLINRFAGNPADVIGGWPGLGRVEAHLGLGEWPHLNKGTPKFLEKYPVSQRRHGYEQMMRLSKRLLDRVHQLAYVDGVSAVSEMLSYTVAFNENFTSNNGLAELYGKMNWTHQITKGEAKALCMQSDKEGKVTINHPDKTRNLSKGPSQQKK